MHQDERVLKLRLLPPSPENPRNSEGSIIQLKDGRLLLAYSHFYGGSADNSPARIAGRFSEDGGRTWTKEDVVILENEGKENTMSVTLLRLASGEIGLFYLIKNSWSDCRLYMRKSADEARTWSKKVCTIPQEGYYVVNNDRIIQLSSGRLLVPAAHHPCPDGTVNTWSSRGVSMCFFSDDNGQTWHKSRTELNGPEGSRSGLQEPGLIELKDSSILML
ncbi:MAG TPA: exo-alpha-sialidase, partial [Candidatus Latescibacteria bacterium]|nr:exo-alpha-sialidase [Candidatus Latescibacterota bacterium]